MTRPVSARFTNMSPRWKDITMSLFYHKYIDTHHFKKIHQKSDIIKKTYRPRATEHLQEVWSNNKLYEFISSLFLGLQLVQIKCHGLRKLGCHKYFQFFFVTMNVNVKDTTYYYSDFYNIISLSKNVRYTRCFKNKFSHFLDFYYWKSFAMFC